MNFILDKLAKSGLLNKDLGCHAVRTSMVIMFFFFEYQKWFEYEAQALIPFISNGPLISWMYPVFGVRGASLFLGAAESTTFVAESAGGFPAMVGNVPFLMKDREMGDFL